MFAELLREFPAFYATRMFITARSQEPDDWHNGALQKSKTMKRRRRFTYTEPDESNAQPAILFLKDSFYYYPPIYV
jgi:hypothetical protein